MKRSCFLLLSSISVASLCAGQSIADSCYMSASPSTSFISTPDLASGDADLMEWTGSSWTGTWPQANITIPPPNIKGNCRAIFIGNGTTWTTNGEAFAVRLNQPLVAGQSYSFNFTYVSHGFGSDGHFNPKVYSDFSASFLGEYIDTLPGVGYSWTTNTFSFTANANQNGHTWITVRTDATISSGIVLSFCPGCQSIPTGVAEIPEATVNIFPNPVSSEFNIESGESGVKKIEVYDAVGREIYSGGFTQTISVASWSDGVYFVQVKSRDELRTQKLVVQH